MKCLRYTSKPERIYDLTYGFANNKTEKKNNDYAKNCKKVKMKDRRSINFSNTRNLIFTFYKPINHKQKETKYPLNEKGVQIKDT